MKIPVKFPIEVGKKYYMENGGEVRIYATDAGGVFRIHGAYKTMKGNWRQIMWDGQGVVCGYVEIKERNITHEEWTPSDKELVWCWDDDFTTGRILGFYDAVNQCIFTMVGKRDGDEYVRYAPFEGEYPEWAKEAYKKLQD